MCFTSEAVCVSVIIKEPCATPIDKCVACVLRVYLQNGQGIRITNMNLFKHVKIIVGFNERECVKILVKAQ
jgi:hypothetical protein